LYSNDATFFNRKENNVLPKLVHYCRQFPGLGAYLGPEPDIQILPTWERLGELLIAWANVSLQTRALRADKSDQREVRYLEVISSLTGSDSFHEATISHLEDQIKRIHETRYKETLARAAARGEMNLAWLQDETLPARFEDQYSYDTIILDPELTDEKGMFTNVSLCFQKTSSTRKISISKPTEKWKTGATQSPTLPKVFIKRKSRCQTPHP
jgi:hypothetical protein